MLYRLLAINIDGSLLTNNRRMTKEAKDAIEFVRSKGVHVTLFTSRNYPSAHKVAHALNLDTPIITHGGAFIANDSQAPFWSRRISEELTERIVKYLGYYECHIRLSHEQFSLGNRKKLQSDLISKAIFSTSDPLFYPLQFIEDLPAHLKEHPVSPLKIDLHFIDEDETEDAVKMITKEFGQYITINQVGALNVELVDKSVSRLQSVKRISEYYGVGLSEVVAIGDGIADIEVIQNVGLGVAMGNAPFEVKRAAKWITRSNEQNGLAYMIIEHFRKQFPIRFIKNYVDIQE